MHFFKFIAIWLSFFSTNLLFNTNSNIKLYKDVNTNIINKNYGQFNIKKSNSFNINILMKYTFYKYDFNGSLMLVADTLETNNFRNNIICIKLIDTYSTIYNFHGLEKTFNSRYVFDLLIIENEKYEKKYIECPDHYYFQILNSSFSLSNDNVLYKKIVDILNYENFLKNSAQTKKLKSGTFNNTTTEIVNENLYDQSILDGYLIREYGFEGNDSLRLLVKNGASNTYSFTTDDSIVNLLPKTIFQNSGSYFGIGGEWGYFAKTNKDIGNDYFTQIIIFDIENDADFISSEKIKIFPVLTKNYKYNSQFDVVLKDIENNLCLTNGILGVSIVPKSVYVSNYKNDSLNNSDPIFPPFRPTDPFLPPSIVDKFPKSYKIIEAYTESLGRSRNISQTFRRVFKHSMKALTGGTKLLVKTFSPSKLFSKVFCFGLDAYVDGLIRNVTTNMDNILTKSVAPTAYFSNETKQYYSTTNDENKIKFGSELNVKELEIPSLGFDDAFSKPSNNNYENMKPLLLKEKTDFLSYSIKYQEEYGLYNSSYILHRLNLDVLENFNTIILGRQILNYVGSLKGEWSYMLNKNVTTECNEINSNLYGDICNFGSISINYKLYKPKESGYYDFLFKDHSYNTNFRIYNGDNLIWESNSKIDNKVDYLPKFEINNDEKINIQQDSFYVPEKPTIKCNVELKKGNTYRIEITRKSRVDSKSISGTTKLFIFRSLAPFSREQNYADLDKAYSKDRFNGELFNRQFIPRYSGQYTFFTNNIKAKFMILDENFNRIITGNNLIRVFLDQYKAYYIIYGGTEIDTNIEVNISLRNYFYSLNNKNNELSAVFNFKQNKYQSFFLCQSEDTIAKLSLDSQFSLSKKPVFNLKINEISNHRETIISNIILDEGYDVYLTNGKIYLFELYINEFINSDIYIKLEVNL